MSQESLRRELSTARHRTVWIEAGPAHGPLMVFVHGWPELGLVWRAQLEHFAARGWRCVAPDMRGYGRSAVPDRVAAYTLREIVTDMVELHDSLGGRPAVWVGHDWGSAVVWNLAAHHPARCAGVANLCIPYLARGMTLEALVALVNRERYPASRYPAGQWDYWCYHREHFEQSARDLEADISGTLSALYRGTEAPPSLEPVPSATMSMTGGWFGSSHRAPSLPRDEALMPRADFDELIRAFRATGFRGANAWYLNDASNEAYALEAPAFGHLELPVLFMHAAWDGVCDTLHSRLADPMRADCQNLTEVVIEGGHELSLERPREVCEALAQWLHTQGVSAPGSAQSGT